MSRTKGWNKWIIGVIGLLLFFGLLSYWPFASKDIDLPETVDFNRHIRPILSQNCFVCHGPDESSREAGLRLDELDFATATLESGHAAIVPGKPKRSALVQRIKSSEPNVQMPPPDSKKTLTAREIALLEKWIKQGAQWKEHWAFVPPEKLTLPSEFESATTSTIIDYFIDKALQEQQLVASKKASPNQLIRRAAYLLTGLPPTIEELQSLSTNFSFERVVDYYLASPHFGERWARHWMDLVRYGESMGHEGDFNISHPFEYRDYLIRAFNQDVPYDLFVQEHLAGDMLEQPRQNPELGFNESIIGTGYFFLGEGKHGPVDPKLEESEKIDNMIDVTSKTFMALTVACAKCHDHKFDPIPTSDYYAMYGMIESSRLGPIPARQTLQQKQQFQELKNLKKEIKTLLGQQMAQALDQPVARFIKQQKQFIQAQESAIPDSLQADVLADFRYGNWEGWYADGWAFGDAPLMAEPLLDPQSGEMLGLHSGKASSRAFAPGIQGVLRSPNFIIEKDYIAVKAAGHNGLIRVIIDNFQVIQNPLWTHCEAIVNNADWDMYKLDVSLAKGHKAYLQFTPGHYGDRRQHTYRISPDDYIEVEYAIAFNDEIPVLKSADNIYESLADINMGEEVIQEWINGKIKYQEVPQIQQLYQKDRQKSASLKKLLEQYSNIAPQLYDSTHFIGMNEGDAVFSPVFIRGSINNQSAKKVPRRFLTALEVGPQTFPQEGSGRLAFAEAITNPKNPLTARIIINRLWHHLFGRGIVETVDNFGLQGKLPSHPDLLDYLAVEMIESAWSMKKMIKTIMLSEAFQRSTELIASNASIDPNNIYLHQFPVRRLEAEAIRDGILAVSGELDKSMYGPPVPVHLTNYMTGRGRPRESGPLDGAGRRSIYTAVRRNFIAPMMLAFDMPIPFSTFGRRNTTNVPAQSLTLMNDPFVKEQARKWAERLCASDLSTEARIKVIYETAFSRAATAEEIQEAKALLVHQAKQLEEDWEVLKDAPTLWAEYCHAIFNLKEFIHLL